MPGPIHSFTSECSKIASYLFSKVSISQAFSSADKIVDPAKSNCREYDAIWDTGATGSVITEKVTQECNLNPIGMVEVHTVAGTERVNQYLINIWLPNKVMIPNVKVTEAKLENIDVLIGMDIINRGDFAVSNFDNKTVFTFRIPSVERIDFVRNPHKTFPLSSTKIGRNAPCPCGSGKKYKKCCGK